jgi:hypothetical protein
VALLAGVAALETCIGIGVEADVALTALAGVLAIVAVVVAVAGAVDDGNGLAGVATTAGVELLLFSVVSIVSEAREGTTCEEAPNDGMVAMTGTLEFTYCEPWLCNSCSTAFDFSVAA